MKQNGYELSRQWFDFCFENPEMIKPIHAAVYFFAIEHSNRLGWKKKIGFPSQMVMEAIGVRKYHTYIKALNDLIEWGFLTLVEKSKNQYSSNIITICERKEMKGTALDNALICHAKKGQSTGQSTVQSTGQSTGQSMGSINKQVTSNNKQERDEENTPAEKSEKRFMVEEGEYESFLNENLPWKEQLCMNTHTTMERVEKAIPEFAAKLRSENVTKKGVADIYSHFANWYRIKTQENGNAKSNYRTKQNGTKQPVFMGPERVADDDPRFKSCI